MKIIDKENRIAEINGYIVSDDWQEIYEMFGIECSCPSQAKSIIAEFGKEPFTLRINSYGGEVDSGVEIYSYLRDVDVTIEITGMAASIASVIAQAAPKGKLLMSPGAGMMVHRASVYAEGNEADMQKAKDMLVSTDKRLLSVYAERSGRPESEIKVLMDNETFLSANEAIAAGLADGISKAKNSEPKLKAVAMFGGMSLDKLKAVLAAKQAVKAVEVHIEPPVTVGQAVEPPAITEQDQQLQAELLMERYRF